MDAVTSVGHLAAVAAVFITIVQAVTAPAAAHATAGASSAAGADLLLTMNNDDDGEGGEDPREDTDGGQEGLGGHVPVTAELPRCQ